MAERNVYVDLMTKNRDFRRLYVGQLISVGGDWFATVALLGLTLELTGSGLAAALILGGNFLPGFLFSPIAGVIADRFDRRKIMIAADLVRSVLALGMLLVHSPGTVWIGIVTLASLATFGSFFGPASQAAIPNLVTHRQLGPALVLMGSSWPTMLAVGAAVGGVVATVLGRDTAFIINAASFLVSAALIAGVRGAFSEQRRHTTTVHPIRDIHEGIAYARSDGRLVALLATKAGFGVGAGVISLLPLFAAEVFGGGDLAIGILFGARGVGAVLGPFAARAFVGENQRRLFLAIGGAMALYGVTYLLFPRMPALLPAALCVLVAHLGGGSQWVMSSYGLQQLAPDHVRGRILAFDFALVTLTQFASFLAAGWLSDRSDPRTVATAFASIAIVYAGTWTAASRRFWHRAGTLVPIGPIGDDSGGGTQIVGEISAGEGAPTD